MTCLKRWMTTLGLSTIALAIAVGGCGGGVEDEEGTGETHDEIRVSSSFTSRGTGYYPSSSQLEGGFKDRIGKPLKTLQQFLKGDAAYVSVAMDSSAFKYGTRLRIKELEAKYGRAIVFRVVDTGGAFRGRGRARIDVCVANRSASLDSTINGTLHIDVIDEKSGPAEEPPPSSSSSSSGGSSGGGSSSGGSSGSPSSGGSGRACSGDGACNPGNDGSGEICVSGKCVAGCRSNAQCPGSKTCQSGMCD